MAQNPVVTFTMENGDVMKAELYPDIAPVSVNNFISLIQKNFYDGLIFHRVIRGFMIQGGDPQGTGMGGPGYTIKGEFAANGVEAAVMLDTFLLRSVDDVVVRPFYPSALDRRSCHHRVYMAYSTKNYHPYRVDHFIQHVIETKALKPDPNACYID